MGVPDDLVELGRIGEPYALKGWVNVFTSSEDPNVLLKCKQWWISSLLAIEQGMARNKVEFKTKNWECEPFRVLQCKPHSGRIIAHLEGIDQPEVAAQIKGCRVFVSRACFPSPEEGEYYWIDLIACSVVNLEGKLLGVVAQVVDHGAHPILVLKSNTDQEILIPFVEAYVINVDIHSKHIQVDWQEDY
jgi:16S rRNA processing protein RimM